MAFTIDGIVIDRIQYGVAESSDGQALYTLTQLADASINITAESKDAVDSRGTLIKRFYTGKTGEFTANNAFVDFNILAASTGSDKMVAGEGKYASGIQMPCIKTYSIAELKSNNITTVELTGLVEGTCEVIGIANNGSLTELATVNISGTTLTIPTKKNDSTTQWVVKYEKTSAKGVKIINSADEFPSTVKLTLKALAIDPCNPDIVRGCYIVMPSFQVSPETEFSLTTDSQLSFNGTLQVDYCSADKELYSIYFDAEEQEA